MLSMYDQDVLLLSVPAVEEMLAVWGCLYHSLLVVLICLLYHSLLVFYLQNNS